MSSRVWLARSFAVFLFLLVLLTRFVKVDWGDGYFFHPDENNMAQAVSRMSPDDLDPRFYAYGQLPLFLSYFSLRLVGLSNSFENAVISLRLWSGLFSSISVLFIYLIAQKLFPPRIALACFAFSIFSPGLIQSAHFGTTESILLFVFAANLFLSLNFVSTGNLALLLVAAIISGFGLATKVTALILMGPVYLAILVHLFRTKKILLSLLTLLLFTLLALVIFILASPFNLISRADFLSTLKYEASVATGTSPVFYTRQFIGTLPYIFQLLRVFPYALGIPLCLAAAIGWFLSLVPSVGKHKTFWFIIIFSSLAYFVYNGQLYTKWTRFMAPLFILAPLFAANFIKAFPASSKVKASLLVLCLIPGWLFLTIYFQKDIRVTASEWLITNIKSGSTVLSEAGNVVNLPVGDHQLIVVNFDFYGLDASPTLQQELPNHLYSADYLLVPSRRIFKNQSSPSFPYSQRYYQKLFSGELGFLPVKVFSNPLATLLDTENAEETFSVFDHPKIRLYKKITPKSQGEYQSLLTP
ncbi:MAG: glycosyltransferase family 39 protein [Candidatus Shapirobacteria bacterium]|jgi:4-amino-4-deoxy-L-arabinose transferase-like glycosyltransferase